MSSPLIVLIQSTISPDRNKAQRIAAIRAGTQKVLDSIKTHIRNARVIPKMIRNVLDFIAVVVKSRCKYRTIK
jgi:ribosomal protein S19